MSGTTSGMWWAAAGSGGVAGLAGLAALLRSDAPVTRRAVAAVVLTCMTTGIIVYALLAPYVPDMTVRFGVAALAGAGGSSTIDIMLAVLQRQAKTRLGETDEPR